MGYYMITATVLVENTLSAHAGLAIEHGLSVYVEDGAKKILFDCGSSEKAENNARLLGIDVKSFDFVVFSHAHYDHTGGFYAFEGKWIGDKRIVISGESFFTPKYEQFGRKYSYIGAPFSKEFFEEREIEFCICPGCMKISDHCYVVNGYQVERTFYTGKNKVFVHGSSWNSVCEDYFEDECCIVVETGETLSMIVGCSHAGIHTMIDQVTRLFQKPVVSVYGGIHLKDSSKAEVADVIRNFDAKGVKELGLCHCSGQSICEMVKAHPNIVSYSVGTGDTLVFR